MKRLSFERELELSDKLVARREVRRRAAEYQGVKESKVNVRLLNDEDRRIWREGDQAAAELVVAYRNYIEGTAHKIAARYRVTADTSPSIDDVIQEGTVAALKICWSYDLRNGGEKGNRLGRRFSAYAGQHISREMNRLCAREETPYHLDVNVIRATRSYYATKAMLRETLNRAPTDKEVRDNLYSDKNTKVLPNLPMRGQFSDVHETPGETGSGFEVPSAVTPRFVASDDVNKFNARLYGSISRVAGDDVARDVLVYLGADRGYPRDDVKELAEYWDISVHSARRRMGKVIVVLTHPAMRCLLWRELNG